jgi:hypothetical protein
MPTDHDTYLHKVASAPVKEDLPHDDTQPFDTVTATDAVPPPKNVLAGELVTAEEDEFPDEFAPSERDAPTEPEAEAITEAEPEPDNAAASASELRSRLAAEVRRASRPDDSHGGGGAGEQSEPDNTAASASELRGRLAAEVRRASRPGDSYGGGGAGEQSEPDNAAASASELRGRLAAEVRRASRPSDSYGEVSEPNIQPTLLADGAATREKWMRLQASFVDDPRAAVTEGAALVADVLAQLEAAVRGRKQPSGDTEALRLQMRQYRLLVDRLTGL